MELTTAPPDIVPYAVEKNEVFVACDACGYDPTGKGISKSWYFVIINDQDLSFCKHHADKYEVNLLAKASRVKDLRYLLAPVVN
jgi:hypothetical protein